MKRIATYHFVLVTIVALAAGMGYAASAPTAAVQENWQSRENLLMRLSAEWYKLGILNKELSNVEDVVLGIKDIELFPTDVTHLDENRLITLDKKIESTDKRCRELTTQVDQLKAPLADAIAILREMIVGQPVAEMFTILEKGDMERINQMLSIKHSVDNLWRSVDTTITGTQALLRIDIGMSDIEKNVLDVEFIQILQANLGRQSERYYRKIETIKDSLVNRGDIQQAQTMFGIEKYRVKEYLKTGNATRARQLIEAMSQRYTTSLLGDEITVLLMRAHLKLGNYAEALATISRMSDTTRLAEALQIMRLECWYAMGNVASIWQWVVHADLSAMKGLNRNVAIWLAIESGLVMNKGDTIVRIAATISKQDEYLLHGLHALARSYFKNGDYKTAQSVINNALIYKPISKVDEQVRRRIILMRAQLSYEQAEYANALNDFFEILNGQNDFEEALFGITWCYIKLGMYQKAEVTLQKLINQSPQSPRAVEATLVLAQRYVGKAQYEWKKATYLSSQKIKSDMMLQKLKLQASDTTAGIIKKNLRAKNELDAIRKRLDSEPRLDFAALSVLYDRAQRVCDLIASYYQTGSFQEALFSAKREMLLHQVDSVMERLTGGQTSLNTASVTTRDQKASIAYIKYLVKKSAVFSTETRIDRFRWEQEYVNWQKTQIAAQIDLLSLQEKATTDSTMHAALSAKKEGFKKQVDALIVSQDMQRERFITMISDSCRSLLSQELDPSDEVYLRYHLGENYYANENETYTREYEDYEKRRVEYDSLVALFRSGEREAMPEKPWQPTLDHSKSMEQYLAIIRTWPDDTLAYAARYSLAWCYNDLGRFENALAQMDTVADSFPTCTYAPQALMFRGEYYFDRGNLTESSKSYQAVMRYPESEWFEDALYKLAWTQYRLSNPDKAISSFLALVDLGGNKVSGKALLEKESMDYIAISFAETDATGSRGLERAKRFVKRFGDMEKGTLILSRMAEVYRDQGRFDLSKEAYATILAFYPGNAKNPLIEKLMLAIDTRDLAVPDANKLKLKFYRKYNHTSAWAQAQKSPAAIAYADSLCERALYDVAIGYHQIAQQKNNREDYINAIESYEEYLKNYPTTKVANECNYFMADIIFSLGDYQRAAEEYMAVSRRYSDNKYRESAAWNAIVASQQLLKSEGRNQ